MKAKRPKLTKSEQMARVRTKDTAPETRLRRLIWAQGARYRVCPKLPGTPDLVFTRARVAVFVDGCFWHGCPEHYTAPVRNAEFWSGKLARNMARDRRVDAELEAAGWYIIRVWEHDVARDSEGCAVRILAAVSACRNGESGFRAAPPIGRAE